MDLHLQAKRDGAAAKRFFKRLLRSHGGERRKIVTDKLRSYPVAHREVTPDAIHVTDQYANHRAEQSHEVTRVRERGMRRFKSIQQAQRLVTAQTAVSNLFYLGRHLVRAQHSMPVERFATVLAELKPAFIHHSTTKVLLAEVLNSHGCGLERCYFDVPRIRSSTSGGYPSIQCRQEAG